MRDFLIIIIVLTRAVKGNKYKSKGKLSISYLGET